MCESFTRVSHQVVMFVYVQFTHLSQRFLTKNVMMGDVGTLHAKCNPPLLKGVGSAPAALAILPMVHVKTLGNTHIDSWWGEIRFIEFACFCGSFEEVPG